MLETYEIHAPTFTVTFRISAVTHKVTEAPELVSWILGMDRFQVFRVAARREWHIITLPKSNEPRQCQASFQPGFQAAHARPLPAEAVDHAEP